MILLCTPPYCTHKLQPLDMSFMRPLSTYYSAEVKKWLRDHPGRVVTPYQLTFRQAYLKAATMLTAINGFRKCGIRPLDKNVFTDADFITAETTNTENLAREELNVSSISNPNLQIDKGSVPEPLISSENAVHPVLFTEKEDIVVVKTLLQMLTSIDILPRLLILEETLNKHWPSNLRGQHFELKTKLPKGK